MGIGRQFVESTRYEHLGPSDQEEGVPQPPLELAPEATAAETRLPGISGHRAGDLAVMEAIDRRRSVREYAAQPLPQESLSRLLWATQGIKRVMPGVATLRTVPSAGARHALETFVLANSVEGLEPGLYRYVASRHSLVARDNSPGVAQRAVKACLGQRFVESSAATFVWAAVPYRMTWRYGERGYRYLYLDAGHVCQNLYLAAESIGCGVCAIAAFDDEAMDRLVGADGFELFAIYVATVGYPGHPRR